jgi:hypothetical protein
MHGPILTTPQAIDDDEHWSSAPPPDGTATVLNNDQEESGVVVGLTINTGIDSRRAAAGRSLAGG